MGSRGRKPFKIAPGTRLTVTPKTIDISAGLKERGSPRTGPAVTRTVSLPGTGISKSKPSRRETVCAVPAYAPLQEFTPLRLCNPQHRGSSRQVGNYTKLS